MSDLVRLGRLWKGTTRSGDKMLSGVVARDTVDAAITLLQQGGRLLVLSNKNKRPDKQDPDCELFVTPPRES